MLAFAVAMSLNLEKHLNPTKKYVKKEKEFVKCNRTQDLMKMRVERLMEHPVRLTSAYTMPTMVVDHALAL